MDNGTFDFRHLNLLLDINPAPGLMVRSNIEFDHAPDTELGYGGVILEYGFAEYLFKDWLKARVGKVLTPYGFFNEIHDASPAYLGVTVPDSVYKADKRGGFSILPKWVTGLNVLGVVDISDESEFDYVVYVGNGESVGYNEAQFDVNPNKAVGGRAQISFDSEKYILGVSAFYGEKGLSETNLAETHFGYVLSAAYALSNLNIKAEYAQAKLGERTEYGWYIQPSYRIGRYTPYMRVQASDPDDRYPDDYWNTYLAGLNVQVNKHLFVKFEWRENNRGENNNDILTPGNEDFSEFKSSVTVLF